MATPACLRCSCDAAETRPGIQRCRPNGLELQADVSERDSTMTEIALPGLLFFDPARTARREPQLTRNAAHAPRRERYFYCARCRHCITSHGAGISVAGSHEHRCTNPHGLTFHIGCFGEAPGSVVDGTATTAYSWFAGYAWQVALCAHCQAHLGWRFRSSADAFHGLIIDRLTSRANPGA